MSLENLKKHQSERKWYDCSEDMIAMIKAGNISEKDKHSILSIFSEINIRMHHTTLANTVKYLAQILSAEESIKLVEVALKVIKDSHSETETSKDASILLTIHLCIYRIKAGSFDDVEKEILRIKKLKLSRDAYLSHLYLGYLFYSEISNIEKSQTYLHEYIDETGDEDPQISKLMDKCIKLSLLSKEFFDFSAITAMKAFTASHDDKLKSIFIDFQNGDFTKIRKWEQDIKDIICEIVPSEHRASVFESVKEKIYLINVIRICFNSDHKFVYLEKFCNELKIDEIELLQLLLKAFGLKLISGWIDSEKRMLFLDSVIPRQLTMQDISRMKSRFIQWRQRVDDVVKRVESQ